MYVPKFTPTCYLPSADDEWGQVLDPAGDRIQVGARVAVRVFAPRLDNWGDPEWREIAEVGAHWNRPGQAGYWCRLIRMIG